MSPSPIVILHVSAAIIGLLSGFMAMIFRKGSGLHGAAGTVFFVSMTAMSTSGAYAAIYIKPVLGNVVVALLTLYMVATGWRSAKVREARTGAFDIVALLFVTMVATIGATGYIEAMRSANGMKDQYPAAAYFIFGSIAALFAVSDVRMLKRGGVSGARRIARHLWRMSLALLLASVSLYPGQARVFPQAWRDTNLLLLPSILLMAAMAYWMVRISRRKRTERAEPAVEALKVAA